MINTTLILFTCKVYLLYVIVHKKGACNIIKVYSHFSTFCMVYLQYAIVHKKGTFNVIKTLIFHIL